jgi:hypothetical protein
MTADATIMATSFGLAAGDIVRRGTCAAAPYVDESGLVFNMAAAKRAPFNKAAAGFGNL